MPLPRLTLVLRLLAALVIALGAIAPLPQEALAEDGMVRPGKRRPGGGHKNKGVKVRRPNRPRPGGKVGGKVRPVRPGGKVLDPGKAPSPESTVEEGSQRNAMLIERYLNVLEARPGEQFALTRLIELYREEHGNLAGLLSRFEGSVAADPRAFAPRMILGELYRRGGRVEEAMRLLREAAGIRADDPAPHLALARAALEVDDGESARGALEEALRLSSGSERQEVLRQLRDLVVEQDDMEAARRFHQDLVRASGNSLYVRMELGQELARQDRHREAVEELQAVLRQVRGDARARVPVLREMARSQVELGQEEEALGTLRTALRLTQPNTGERSELLEMMVDVYRRGDALRQLVELLEAERGSGFERAELLGRLCDELAEATRAERWYRTALRSNARHVDTRVRLIRLLVRQGRIEEATREYETLTRYAPGEPRFVTELAEMYLRLGQRQRALDLLARTSRTNPNDVAIHAALLNLYSGWGEDELALGEARILTRIDPRDETHLVDLGERHFQSGDRERAMGIWRRIPSVAGERWRGLAVLGDVFADHEMGEEALGLYEEALALRPNELGVVRRMANLLERLRRWDQAVEQWTRLIEIAPERDVGARREARTRIVTIWANQRRLHGRLPELRRRFAGTPRDIEAGRFLYEALERVGRPPEALAVIRQVIVLRPGDVEALLALERGLVRQGDLAAAMDALRRLLELEPRRSREFYQRLASYAMQLQRDSEALEYAARALELNPDDAQGHYRLAQLYRQQGNDGRAVTEYRRALELNDRLFDGYLELAELHEMHSRPQDAIRVYLRLLGKSPDDAMVRRAGSQARLLAMMDGSAERLEHDLLPLALAQTERVVYRRILVDLYHDLTASLIQIATNGEGEDATRAQAQLEALGQRSLQPLLDALLDIDPDQQKVAITMLGHLGNPSAAVPLVAYSTGDGDRTLQLMALLAAGQVGDERIVSDLVEILNAPPLQGMKEIAAFGLARIASAAAIEALRRHLDSPSVPVRALACIGLGRTGEARHLDELRERFDRDDQQMVRRAAAWALGQIGTDEARDHLVRHLSRAPQAVRPAVAWSLGTMDDHRARRALASALFDFENQDLCRAAAWALRRSGSGAMDDEARAAYVRMPELPLRVETYLDELMPMSAGEGSALAALRRAGPELEVALERALGGRGVPDNRRIIMTLRALTGSRSGELRISHLIDDDERGDESVIEAMAPLLSIVVRRSVEHLEHPEPEIRRRSTLILARVDHPDAARGLIQALNNDDPGVRTLALDNLARTHNSSLVEPLSGLLRSDDWQTRVRTVDALGRIPGPEAAGALAGVLRADSSAAVRAEALSALARRGGEVREPLRAAATNDVNSQVREAACRALASLSGGEGDRPELPAPCSEFCLNVDTGETCRDNAE